MSWQTLEEAMQKEGCCHRDIEALEVRVEATSRGDGKDCLTHLLKLRWDAFSLITCANKVCKYNKLLSYAHTLRKFSDIYKITPFNNLLSKQEVQLPKTIKLHDEHLKTKIVFNKKKGFNELVNTILQYWNRPRLQVNVKIVTLVNFCLA